MYKILSGLMAFTLTACSPSDGQEDGSRGVSGQNGVYQTTAARNPAVQPPVAPMAAPAAMPSGAIRVQKADVIDQSGFGRPMVAATVMIPAGWQTQGGVLWIQNMTGCGKKTPHFAWRATSPDGMSTMEILPEENWSGSNQYVAGMPQQTCPNIQIQTAKEYIHTWVQYNRPGARVLDYRDRYDTVAELDKQLKQMQQQQPPMPGIEMRQWIEGGQALIGYNQQGTEMRELIGIAVIFTLTRMQGVMPGEIAEYLTISTLPGFSMRAPDGRLDFKMAEMLRKSGRPDPQWQAKMAQHYRKMSQINTKGAMDRSKIISRTYSEISAMQHDSWKKKNASDDYLQRERVEAIRGTETYNDPSGGTIELDNTYQHAWQLNDGSYVLTDDHSFNPYAVMGQDGQKLEVTK